MNQEKSQLSRAEPDCEIAALQQSKMSGRHFIPSARKRRSSGRLVGFVSGSLPAMGCGGSKAQPTSEVVQPMSSLLICLSVSASNCVQRCKEV